MKYYSVEITIIQRDLDDNGNEDIEVVPGVYSLIAAELIDVELARTFAYNLQKASDSMISNGDWVSVELVMSQDPAVEAWKEDNLPGPDFDWNGDGS
jgi:hypothetical protein